MPTDGVSGKRAHHRFITAGLLMPENSARSSQRLCTISFLCGALYSARTGGATEMEKNQAFKKLLSFLEQKRKLFKCCVITTAFVGMDGALHVSGVNLVRHTCSESYYLRGDSEAPDVI